MELSKYYINENDTIISAITAIDENHERSVFVVNGKKKLIGVISQGDILKNIINGINLYTKVGKIANKGFIYMNNKNMTKAYEIFKNKNLSIIPIIDSDFCLIDIVTTRDIYNYLEKNHKN